MKLVGTPCSLRQHKGDSFYTTHSFATGSFLSLGAERPGRETNTRLQNKNAWSYTTTHTRIQGDSKRWTQFRTSIFPELCTACE